MTLHRDTILARGRVPALDRATIHPYEDAVPGPVSYQREAHPVGLEAERLLGELDGGQALLFSSGMGAATALVLALLKPGATVAVAGGGYYGTVRLSPTSCLAGDSSSWSSTRPGRRRAPSSCGSNRARTR